MKRSLIISLTALLGLTYVQAKEPVDYVNPFIGTTNFGTANPGALTPNGMMSVSPFNVMGSPDNRYDKDARWWSSPYDVTNSFLTGFSHVNLSGVGCPELGSLLLMPTTGPLEVDYHDYGSKYSSEKAHPGYYSVEIDKYNVLAEATATPRTGMMRYTFPKGESHILLNLGQALSNETGATLRRVGEREFEGSRMLGTFCYNPQAVFPIYFVMRVNKTPKASGYWKKQPPMQGVEAEWTPDNGKYKIYTKYGRDISGDDIGAWYTFDTEDGEQIEVSVGVSFVSVENARENLDREQHGMSFDQIHAEAREKWNGDLSRIEVEGGTDDQKEVFYTALYHALIHPNILNDVNGQYPMMEGDGVGTVEQGHNRYTVYSLWDTYRNVHQLLTLLYPDRQTDMVRSMVDIYKEWGWMPKWELYGRETFTMEGDPAIPVIVDTWRKGLRDFDMDTAYEAFRKSANTPGAENKMRPDVDPYISMGYIPLGMYAADNSGDNSVSHALEYYVADNALAWLAESRGDKAFADSLVQRSRGYKHYYSKESGTLRPITPDGKFLDPFDPTQGENFEPVPGFHEGTAWNYTFFVPHDIPGLAKLMGGNRKFVDKLQMVFDKGYYDPANEPDIAYPYLFSRFKGEEWRTQRLVSELLGKHFTTKPDGIPGNDDTGTMSTWALFSMMGFYPDVPGVPEYTLTTPVFDKVTLHIDPAYHNGVDKIVIETTNPEAESVYTRSATLGGKKVPMRITHDQLMQGRELKFTKTTDGKPAK